MILEVDGRASGVWLRPRGRRPDVLSGFSREQIEKARLLLADDALRPHGHPGVFWVVSNDGERLYLTSSQNCNCPAGRYMLRCYHLAAARIATDAWGCARKAHNRARRERRAAARAAREHKWGAAQKHYEQAQAADETARLWERRAS